MSRLYVGLFHRLTNMLEPGDVLAIDALIRIQKDGVMQEITRTVFTTVLERTTEALVFSKLALSLLELSLENHTHYLLGSTTLKFQVGTIDIVQIYGHKEVLVFKGLRTDLSDANLATLEPLSTSKN